MTTERKSVIAVRFLAFIWCVCIWLFPAMSYAQFSDGALAPSSSKTVLADSITLEEYKFNNPLERPLSFILKDSVADTANYPHYSGMAVYLGASQMVRMPSGGKGAFEILKVKTGTPIEVDGDWVGYKGRFEAIIAKSETGHVSISNGSVTISWPAGATPDLTIVSGLLDTHAKLDAAIPDLRKLQYIHLPKWLRVLSNGVEWVYKTIASFTGFHWGFSLILLAVVIKLLLLPISLLTTRFQEQANGHKAALEPIFENIKKNYKGETAHKKIMAAYKARGITPYYSLKPLLATMISLPVLIAIFNMLGEIEPLRQEEFLWAPSLAYPDSLFQWQGKLPLFGHAFNLLPFIMAGFTFLSAWKMKSSTASEPEIKRQKRNIYLMGAAFFLLFYPFPSAMVFYWTCSTVLQLPINKFLLKST